jgi:hypothetical protein
VVASRVAILPHVIPLFVLYCTASYAGIHSYTSMIARHGFVLTVGMATLRKSYSYCTLHRIHGAGGSIIIDDDDDQQWRSCIGATEAFRFAASVSFPAHLAWFTVQR